MSSDEEVSDAARQPDLEMGTAESGKEGGEAGQGSGVAPTSMRVRGERERAREWGAGAQEEPEGGEAMERAGQQAEWRGCFA